MAATGCLRHKNVLLPPTPCSRVTSIARSEFEATSPVSGTTPLRLCRRFAAASPKKIPGKFDKMNGSTASNVKRTPNLLPNIRRINKSSFDIFTHMASSKTNNLVDDNSTKRKPSQRVLSLADQILALSLVEAADLCELCQEALQARPPQEPLPARNPFPHPGGFFSGGAFSGFPAGAGVIPPPMPFPMQYAAAAGQPFPIAPPGVAVPAQPEQAAAEGSPSPSPPKAPEPVNKEPEVVAIKLVEYDNSRKIAVIKEVRAMLGLGLKESKDTVEGSPRVLKKGVAREEALKLKTKLEAAGATISLE